MDTVNPVRLILAPLSPLHFSALAALLILAGAAYCLSYGMLAGETVHPLISLSFGIASTLPWCWACGSLKRASRTHKAWVWQITSSMLLLAALTSSVTLSVVLSRALPSRSGVDHATCLCSSTARFRVGLAAFLLLRSAALRPRQESIRVPELRPAGAAPGGGCNGRETCEAPLDDAIVGTVTPAPEPALAQSHIESSTALASVTLKVPSRHGIVSVQAGDIEYVKAAGNYVELVTGGRTLLMRTTLAETAGQLRAGGFVRVHRSLLVKPSSGGRPPKGSKMVAPVMGVCEKRGGAADGRQYTERARELFS